MQTVNEKPLTRQQKLKIWIIENKFDVPQLTKKSGLVRQTVSQELYYRPSMRADLRNLCIDLGIPVDLLPPQTRKKSELLRENLELRQRLAALEGQAAPQAQAG
ncbi:hypothetical protein [Humidesulfovibrio idahonensis]